ncbi:cellulose synthase [Brucella pseudogrignonensis]|uniref:tetratricopeptide repeat protein n=1 Tax=Brucella pseudogrignonensis TaxID=419475 RepID=UPI0028B60EE5|nr:cellulose synthase [Brucella pseudogrignonensis]MDT6942123.1 cellulose synthase [Brucella pseudogrignonensis]
MKNILISVLLGSVAVGSYYLFFKNNDPMSDLQLGIANQAPSPVSIRASQTATQVDTTSDVDESALRYFATRGDKVRMQAEITRLKSLHPDWVPPEDPTAPAKVSDNKLDELWLLYSKGEYSALRKAIASRKSSEPDWVVPDDLLKALDQSENRERLINASNNAQYEMVINLAAGSPEMLTCNEVDILWRLSEAFAKVDKGNRALDGYLYIINNCSDPNVRTGTIQKALTNLSYDEMQKLLEVERRSPDGQREFAGLEKDIARHFVGLAALDKDLVIDPSNISALENIPDSETLGSDAEMLGWYYMRRDEPTKAEKWFDLANKKQATVTSAQGMALVLNARKDYSAAEDLMYPWHDKSPDATLVYFDSAANLLSSDPPNRMPETISPQVLTRIANATVAEKNITTAEQLGWYARAMQQDLTAVQWFQTALSWDPSNEPAAYGLALGLLSIDDENQLRQVKQNWNSKSARIREVGDSRQNSSRSSRGQSSRPSNATASRTVRSNSYNPADRAAQPRSAGSGNARSCAHALEGPMPTGGNAVSHGWCLMELNRPLDAVRSFESALMTGSASQRSEAAYGQALAYLRAGLVDKAAVSATKAPLSPQRQKELRVSILSDKAVAAYQAGNFRDVLSILEQRAQLAAPRKDLMGLQAAAYLKLRRYDDARVIYEALAATGDREGIRGMAAIRDIQGR